MTLHFLIPGDINTLTGGYIYDKIVTDGLGKQKYAVVVHSLPLDFPFPSIRTLGACKQIFDNITTGDPVFIDSLAFGSLDEILSYNHGRYPVIPIMHLPLSKDPNFPCIIRQLLAEHEKTAFRYATHVVAVSEFTKQLIVKYGVNPEIIVVIPPGNFETARKNAYRSLPEHLLCIGSYLPGKGQLQLVQALAGLKNYEWTLTMYGIQHYDSHYVHLVKSRIIGSALKDRIRMNKQISGDLLEAAYLQSDLFILPSYFENFSMALNEALMHGLPVITTTAGGIPYSVPENMGLFVPAGSVIELRKAIEKMFITPALYKQLCIYASMYYKTANTWQKCISGFHSLVSTLS